MPRYYPLLAYYPLLEMLLCSFNAILFSLVSFLCLRDYRNRRTQWGGYIYPSILLVFVVLFVTHLASEVSIGLFGRRTPYLDVPEIASNYLITPLVAQLFYRSEKDGLIHRGAWRFSLVGFYVVSFFVGALSLNSSTGWWAEGWPRWQATGVAFGILMIATAIWCSLLLWVSRGSKCSPLASSQRRWLQTLFAAWICLFFVEVLVPENLGSLLEKLLPLSFLFVITYYIERSTFFDILIKQGVFVFAVLVVLTAYFVFVPPVLERLQFHTWIGSLVWALSVWPIVLVAPWGHRKLSDWLDRRWLGRRFSPAEATRRFLSGLQGVISESELAWQAEDRLAEIFRCDAEVVLVPSSELELQATRDLATVPIRLAGRCVGQIRIRSLRPHVRFMSEDIALLTSLADGLAFLLENLRLREKRLEQEQKEQELRLSASRSELKALRAQINPHFLFNALNTIASLIPRRPERAEETIEELAEVFRHTLTRSEREWIPLEEELEAIRSYLHIEQARFGEDFKFRIDCEDEAGHLRIPSMTIQTLVENAIKHGVGSLATAGLVEVLVRTSASRLIIEVRDNGLGFQEPAVDRNLRSGGYSLRNVRERLQGYFGDDWRLSVGRDQTRDMTLVSIEMPRAPRPAGMVAP